MSDNFNGNVLYSPGNITKSVWDETANANRTLQVNSAGTATPGATEATQLLVLAAVTALDPTASLNGVGTPVYFNYDSDSGGTNVTSATWVQIIADSGATKVLQLNIFDSSGQSLYLGMGAAASEVTKMIICPGGQGQVSLQIPAHTRVSLKAVNTSATVGVLVLNLFG